MAWKRGQDHDGLLEGIKLTPEILQRLIASGRYRAPTADELLAGKTELVRVPE